MGYLTFNSTDVNNKDRNAALLHEYFVYRQYSLEMLIMAYIKRKGDGCLRLLINIVLKLLICNLNIIMNIDVIVYVSPLFQQFKTLGINRSFMHRICYRDYNDNIL